MKVEFRRIKIQGFKTFIEPAVIDFTKLNKSLIFVTGDNRDNDALHPNGAGKSSLWDALSWCLYGRTVEGLKNPDVRPWNVNGPTEVTVTVAIDGARHTIFRSTAPNRLQVDGRDSDQDAVISLVGLDYVVFLHTVLFGQSKELFFDLDPQPKMALFSEVLQHERWERRAAAASKRVTALERDLERTNSKRDNADALLEQLSVLIERTAKQHDAWAVDQAEIVLQRSADLKKAKAELESVQKKHDTANLAYDGAATEAKAITAANAKLIDALNIAATAVKQCEINRTAAERQRASIVRELEAAGKGGKCPTCGQSLTGTRLGLHQENLRQQLVALDKEIADAVPAKVKKDYTTAEAALTAAKQHERTFLIAAEKARDEMDFLAPTIAALTGKIKHLEESINDRKEQTNPHAETLMQLKKKIAAAKADRTSINEQADAIGREIEQTKVWVAGFKEIQLYVIDETLNELDIVTNAILADIGLGDWAIRYDIERETKSGTIKKGLSVFIKAPNSPNEVKWKSWCGGERQRLRLVGSLALATVLLNHAGVEFNLEIFDEPCQHLSDAGIDAIVDILHDRSRTLNKTVMFTEHQVIESTKFDHVLTVVRDHDHSYVEIN